MVAHPLSLLAKNWLTIGHFAVKRKLLLHATEFTTNAYLQLQQIHLWSLLPTTSIILAATTKHFDRAIPIHLHVRLQSKLFLRDSIKGQAPGQLTGCKDDFAHLVLSCSRKFFL